jgi:hypothetical protein
MSEKGDIAPIILIVSPLLVGAVVFFATKMRVPLEELLLGLYGFTEVGVKLFGLLFHILRKRDLHNSGGQSLWRQSESNSWASGILWGHGVYLGFDKGDQTTFAVVLALLYFSVFLCCWYLQQHVRPIVERTVKCKSFEESKFRRFILKSVFLLSHILGINTHFLIFEFYTFSWDNSHPVATKAKLRHFQHMLRYQKLTMTTNIVPTLAICLYRLNVEYSPFASSFFQK